MIASTGRPVPVSDAVASQWSRYSFRVSLRSFCACQSRYAVVPPFVGRYGGRIESAPSSPIEEMIGSPVAEVTAMKSSAEPAPKMSICTVLLGQHTGKGNDNSCLP